MVAQHMLAHCPLTSVVPGSSSHLPWPERPALLGLTLFPIDKAGNNLGGIIPMKLGLLHPLTVLTPLSVKAMNSVELSLRPIDLQIVTWETEKPRLGQ